MKNREIDDKYFGFLFHYYRAEVYRETNWRSRMDVTSNWVIVVTGAILSFAFGEPRTPHVVIILNYCIALFFLYIEARRFRTYVMLRARTRLMEKHLLGPVFSGQRIPAVHDWGKRLAENLSYPRVPMSRIESLAWRLRRQYMFILPVIFAAWVARIYTVPEAVSTLPEAIAQAQLWFIPGGVVFSAFVSSLVVCIALAYIYVPRASLVDDLP